MTDSGNDAVAEPTAMNTSYAPKCQSEARYEPTLATKSEIAARKQPGSAEIFWGFVLCLTGIGAIIGIPLIVFGLYQSITMPFKQFETGGYIGPCPYCGTELGMVEAWTALNCHVCRKRVVRKENLFVGYD